MFPGVNCHVLRVANCLNFHKEVTEKFRVMTAIVGEDNAAVGVCGIHCDFLCSMIFLAADNFLSLDTAQSVFSDVGASRLKIFLLFSLGGSFDSLFCVQYVESPQGRRKCKIMILLDLVALNCR
jgi:hypothetical protein